MVVWDVSTGFLFNASCENTRLITNATTPATYTFPATTTAVTITAGWADAFEPVKLAIYKGPGKLSDTTYYNYYYQIKIS